MVLDCSQGFESQTWIVVKVDSLTTEYDLLPGDSLIAAGIVACFSPFGLMCCRGPGMVGYAGPFAGEYRQHFEKLWLKTEDSKASRLRVMRLLSSTVPCMQDEEGITHKQGASLVNVLGQPAVAQALQEAPGD